MTIVTSITVSDVALGFMYVKISGTPPPPKSEGQDGIIARKWSDVEEMEKYVSEFS